MHHVLNIKLGVYYIILQHHSESRAADFSALCASPNLGVPSWCTRSEKTLLDCRQLQQEHIPFQAYHYLRLKSRPFVLKAQTYPGAMVFAFMGQARPRFYCQRFENLFRWVKKVSPGCFQPAPTTLLMTVVCGRKNNQLVTKSMDGWLPELHYYRTLKCDLFPNKNGM